MNFAQITISGNVGQAPEIKEINGTKVANFSVAVNESYNTKAGEKVEKTHWYPIEAWDGSQGKGLVSNVIEKYLTVGTTVLVQGMPMIETYEKDGEKRKAFKIKLAGTGSTFRLTGGAKKDSSTVGDSPKVEDTDEVPF